MSTLTDDCGYAGCKIRLCNDFGQTYLSHAYEEKKMGSKNADQSFSPLSPNRKALKQEHSLGIAYSNFIFTYPLAVLLTTLFLFGVVPLGVNYYFPLSLDGNPEKGFDTRDTEYAGPRLAWTKLQPSLMQGSRIILDVVQSNNESSLKFHESRKKRELLNFFLWRNDSFANLNESLQRLKFRTKRQTQIWLDKNVEAFALSEKKDLNNAKIVKRSWADDLIASFSSVACYDQPIPAMNYLSQLIITIPTYEELFSTIFLTELCSLYLELGDSLRAFDQLTPYRSIWHVGNYFACLAPESRVNCSYLTPSDVRSVRLDIETCNPHRKSIVNCRRSCEHHESLMQEIQNAEVNILCDAKCKNDAAVPKRCSSQMMSDLFYRVLPKDLMNEPLNLNIFLPFYTFASYQMQGYDVELSFFTKFEEKIKLVTANSKSFKLKGILTDVKRDILLNAAISDSKFSLIAGVCVFVLIALYSISLSYSVTVLIQLTLSVTSALSIYRIFNNEFPLLNLIVFVLLISIGSDGAFLLFSGFPSPEVLNKATFHKCLRHTATTMFLTQFSTVVPFFINILSSVIAFRSFGLFAGLTLITNYTLLISFLPSFLVIQNRFLNPWLVRHLPSSFWYCFPSFSYLPKLSFSNSAKVQQTSTSISIRPSRKIVIEEQDRSYLEQLCVSIQSLINEVLPIVLIQGRFVWICSLAVVFVISGIICVTQLRLPQYNPLQLFVTSNPHEYYDNHAEKLFYFISHKIALPLTVRLVWGIKPVHLLGHFEAQRLTRLTASPDFHLSSAKQLRQLAAQLKRFRTLSFIQHPHKFWPEKYLDWSKRLACSDPESVCCNLENGHYSDTYLDYCMRVSTAQLRTQYNDTPIYHNITFELLGYTALLPTQLKYSHRYTNLSDSFKQFDKEFQSLIPELPMWYTTEWHLMSTWFDLQRSIISDCKQSVIISSFVVLVFSAIILRWKCICSMISIVCIIITTTGTVVFFGWEIGVLEGVILVLVVGLSFDYTLHYGASIPRKGCAMHRIQISVQKATLPVAMAALSSIIAGGVMLLSQTHAFFQVSVFLVVSTTMSFVFATFFFLPLFYILISVKSKRQNCELCEKAQNNLRQMQTLALPLQDVYYPGRSPVQNFKN